VLHVKEVLDRTVLAVGDDVVKSLWVRIRGKATKRRNYGKSVDQLLLSLWDTSVSQILTGTIIQQT